MLFGVAAHERLPKLVVVGSNPIARSKYVAAFLWV